jgi:outer membrane lipoprotein
MGMKMAAMAMVLMMLTGCAGVISSEGMKMAEKDLLYDEVKKEPEKFAGKNILLAGVIAHIRNTKEGGELEIVQLPADSSGRPITGKRSEGRALILWDDFLDPLVYHEGQMVSLVGEVKGKETRQIEGIQYQYPILQARELHIVEPHQVQVVPSFSFGFGFGF